MHFFIIKKQDCGCGCNGSEQTQRKANLMNSVQPVARKTYGSWNGRCYEITGTGTNADVREIPCRDMPIVKG